MGAPEINLFRLFLLLSYERFKTAGRIFLLAQARSECAAHEMDEIYAWCQPYIVIHVPGGFDHHVP